MNCQEARDQIRICKAQGAELDARSNTHLECCDLCTQWYADLELDSVLRTFEIPEPGDGFVDRVIETASRRDERQSRTPAFAMAAAVAVISIAIGLFVGRGQHSDVSFEVAMAPYEERLVEVVINTAAERKQTTLTIELAHNLEFSGSPDKRTVQWQTDLAAGKNLLKLPLLLNRDADTHFTVLMSNGSTEQTMRVDVRAKPQLDQGISA